jgi:hypothetical protein
MLFSSLPIAFIPDSASKSGVVTVLFVLSLVILLVVFIAWKIRTYIKDSEEEALREILDDEAHPPVQRPSRYKSSPAATLSDHK